MKECDLVMKGGITSGVVYPRAICELAREFHFRGIGGTSAGAIAASLTAAAEYGRRKGLEAPFSGMGKLPEELSTKMFGLFQPQTETRRAYAFATGLENGVSKAFLKSIGWFRLAVYLLLGLGLGFWNASAVRVPSGLVLVAFLAPALLVVGGALVLEAAALVRSARRGLENNNYGLCRGFEPGGAEQLTGWLHGKIQEFSGLEEPLTFAHLEGDPDFPALENLRDSILPSKERVFLRMVASNLTHGRPYTFPTEFKNLYFKPEELRLYFPETVVTWMEKQAGDKRRNGFVPLPRNGLLPVVVAARMSLSFPVLLSGVPLYSVDYRRPPEERRPERCLFSDGGLCSNFPIHFFDAPLPLRPTFAINLAPFPLGPPPKEGVSMPSTNLQGASQERWQRFEGDDAERPSLGGFLAAAFDTARNWRDNVQLRLPGYRDRIAELYLSEDEGGLNLKMPPGTIMEIARRGGAAGRLLLRHFGQNSQNEVINWENHAWVRYRTTMSLLSGTLLRLAGVLGQGPYPELDARPNEALPSYPFYEADQRPTDWRGAALEPRSSGRPTESAAKRQHASRVTHSFLAHVDAWKAELAAEDYPNVFDEPNVPSPQPVVRIVPEL